MDKALDTMIAIATAIVGVAIIAVIVSRNSQTPAVLQAAGSAFSNALTVAESPVTGAAVPANLSYGLSSSLGGVLPSNLLGSFNVQNML